jgi:hypothetical protein
MATINKSLTTYLPALSVEWLESYCLDYKHLQNKDGNPKLGTAIADIIARLADGELALPEKIESQSTAPIQYSTEFITLKGEVEELKKLLTEYGTDKLPDTVLDLETVKYEIEVALEPIKESVSNLDADIQSLTASLAKAPTLPRKEKPNADSLPEWVDANNRRFYLMLVDDWELLAKVADAIALTPEDNLKLAANLVGLGFHKQDGTALDSSNMSRIKKVVGRLKTDT